MLIKIDYREIKLIQYLTGLIKDDDKIKMVNENLPIGDIIICDDLGQEKSIIERKSLADLAASIRDGRYKEQSFRLNQCTLHNHQIYYLIEGDLRFYKPFKGLPDKKALISAMVSMSYFKGFSLFRTINLEETAEWVLQFAHKLEKEGAAQLPYYMTAPAQVETSYKNYLTYTEGDVAYSEFNKKMLSEKARELAKQFASEIQEQIQKSKSLVATYDGLFVNFAHVVEYYDDLVQKNNIMIQIFL